MASRAMNRAMRARNLAVERLIARTGATEPEAVLFLETANWVIDAAVELHWLARARTFWLGVGPHKPTDEEVRAVAVALAYAAGERQIFA